MIRNDFKNVPSYENTISNNNENNPRDTNIKVQADLEANLEEFLKQDKEIREKRKESKK